MTKSTTKTNVTKNIANSPAAAAATKKKKDSKKDKAVSTPPPSANGDDNVEQVDELQKEIQQFKLKSKIQREEHEKEIRKKKEQQQHQHDDEPKAAAHNGHHHAAPGPTNSQVNLSGIKRSKPQTPISAYQFFKDANPSKSKGWCQETWRELPDHERRVYQQKADEDKKRYQTQMAEYERIHAHVTHQKVQKKDKKKKLKEEDDHDDSSANNNSGEDDHDGEKKVSQRKSKKSKSVLSQSPAWSSPSTSHPKPSNTNGGKATTQTLANSKKKIHPQFESGDEDDVEEDDDNDDEDEEDEDCSNEDEDSQDDDDDDEDEDEDEEEKHIQYEDDVYADEEDEGYAEMKRGFKSRAAPAKATKFGRRWNK